MFSVPLSPPPSGGPVAVTVGGGAHVVGAGEDDWSSAGTGVDNVLLSVMDLDLLSVTDLDLDLDLDLVLVLDLVFDLDFVRVLTFFSPPSSPTSSSYS